MNYYTIQVHLCDEKTVHEVKDVEETNINQAHDIWHRGIKIKTSPVAWEIISRFLSSAFI